MATSTTELILKFTGDPRSLKSTLADIRRDLTQSGQAQIAVNRDTNKQIANDAKSQTKTLNKEEQERIRAAQSLQKQRSAALIAQWKADTKAVEREERERVRSAVTLQRQRSAALIAQWRTDQREQIRIARETDRSLRQQSGFSSLAAGAVGGLTALVGLNVVSEIRQAGAAWLDYSSKLQTTRIAFTTMLGSAQAADDHLKELERFALTTPFEFGELIDASQRMQALGFQASQIVPILTDVGNAVAAAGGGSERLDRVTLALSQIQSKGKVMTQELNQLAEAGIPAFRILQETLGKSRNEINKLLESGSISSKVFLDAFQKFSKTNFGGLMEQQSRTFAGAMSNIKDTLLQTSQTAFEPFFKAISEITIRIGEELQKGQPTLESVTRSITTGLIEIISTAGAQAGAGFVESTARKIGDPNAWKQLLANVSGFTVIKSFFSGLFSIDPEDLFGLGDVDIPSVKIPNLTVPLKKLTDQQGEVSEASKKAGEVLQGLSQKVASYGQQSERAATAQKLLALGMEALTSAEGRQAIQLAELIDKRRIANELNKQQERLTKDLAAITESKYKTTFNALSQTLQTATISFLELKNAEIGGLTELERFNLGLGAQVDALLTNANAAGFTADQIELLFKSLLAARQAMTELTAAQKIFQQQAKTKQTLEELLQFQRQQAETLRQLRFGDKTALQEVEEFIKLMGPKWIDAMTEAERASTSFWLKFNAHIIDSAKRMQAMIALMQETANVVPRPGGPAPEGIPSVIVSPEEDAAIQIEVFGKIVDQISVWQEALSSLRGQMAEFSDFTRGTFIQSLSGIADALAQGVATWALYGGSFAKAMKQALAALGAKIAAEATLQAAIHAAYAIGSLAFGDFGAAAKHALAAAKFAAIGGLAAIATRAIAGNDFKQSSSAFSGSGAGAGSTSQRQQIQPLDLDRAGSPSRAEQNQQAVLNVNVNVKRDAGSIVEVVVDNHRSNGEIRKMIQSELVG